MRFSLIFSLRSALLMGLGATALVGFVQCTSEGTAVGSSESNHTEGETTNENSAYAWTQSDFASFKAASATVGPGVELPQDHPITVRFQKWVDAFDATARKITLEYSGQELAAPKPVAVIFNSRTQNAWASTVRTCIGGPVDLSQIPLAPSPAPAGSDAGTTPATSVSLFGSMASLEHGSCAEPANWPSKDGAFGWLERHSAPMPDGGATPCRYETKDGKITVTGAAEGDAGIYRGCYAWSYGGVTESPTTEVEATTMRASNYVYFTTRILQTLPDEKAAAAVIAHELSHFYKAHGSGLGTYNYFYEQKTPAVPGKPVPVADSAALQTQLRDLQRSPVPVPIAGTLLSERLRSFILDLIAQMNTGRTPAPAPNAPALDATCTSLFPEISPFVNELRGFGGAPSPAATAKYLEIEKRFVDCATLTSVGPNGALTSAQLSPLLSRDFYQGSALFTATSPATTLSALLGDLQGKAKEVDFDAVAFRAGIVARHLGLYTTEQEADDLSMELLTKTGLDASDHIAAWAHWVQDLAADPTTASILAGDDIAPADCISLWQAGWKKPDANGVMQPVSVPLGRLNDPHHGFCYRLYNFTREAEAHQPVTSGTLPTFDTPWSDVQASATAELAKLGTPATPATAPTMADEPGIVDSY